MTRDEAIEIWHRDDGKLRSPAEIIDAFAALGMLKLDEPKSAEERFYEIVSENLAVDSPAMREPRENKRAVGMIFYEALTEAGLRIVEK